MITGSRKKDAVFYSSAVPPSSQIDCRASGSVRLSLMRLAPPTRALWISALACPGISILLFSLHSCK
jgi:hypothetical protein